MGHGQPARWDPAGRVKPCQQGPDDREDERGFRGRIEDEHAALARAPACRESHVLAEDRDGLGASGGQRLLDRGEGEPPVGEDVVDRGHHVALRHHREAGQVGGLDIGDIGAGQALAVEGRVRRRVREQPAQAVTLGGLDPVGAPGQAFQVLRYPGEDLGLEVGAEAPPAGVRSGRCGHRSPGGSGRPAGPAGAGWMRWSAGCPAG
jgi:hypothetical protein